MVRPAHIEGAGAEQAQQGRARARSVAAARGDLRANTRQGRPVNAMRADGPTPQAFAPHPVIATMVDRADTASDFTLPHLPGRVPAAGWDGEPGAGAPNTGLY